MVKLVCISLSETFFSYLNRLLIKKTKETRQSLIIENTIYKKKEKTLNE